MAVLLAAMIDLSEQQSIYQQTYPGWEHRNRHPAFGADIPEPPSDAGLSAHLRVAKMLGNKVERELLQRLASVIAFNREVGLNHYCGVLMAAAAEFAMWRTREVPLQRIREDYKEMSDDALEVLHKRAAEFAKLQEDLDAASGARTPDS